MCVDAALRVDNQRSVWRHTFDHETLSLKQQTGVGGREDVHLHVQNPLLAFLSDKNSVFEDEPRMALNLALATRPCAPAARSDPHRPPRVARHVAKSRAPFHSSLRRVVPLARSYPTCTSWVGVRGDTRSCP